MIVQYAQYSTVKLRARFAGIYGGIGADMLSAFVKKGLTFWIRDVVVGVFMGAFARA